MRVRHNVERALRVSHRFSTFPDVPGHTASNLLLVDKVHCCHNEIEILMVSNNELGPKLKAHSQAEKVRG